MSMDLTKLGRVICQDFDNRVLELNSIRSECNTKLKNDKNELMQIGNDERSELQTVQRQVWQDTVDILVKYKEEGKTMIYGLKDEETKNNEEITAWAKEEGENLKGWYEAGAYLLRKRTGR